MQIDDFCSAVLYGHSDPDYKIEAGLNHEPISLSVPACNQEIKKILKAKGYKGTPQMSEYLTLKYSEHSTMSEHVRTTSRTKEDIAAAKQKLLKSIMKWIMDKQKSPATDDLMDCYVKQLTEEDLTVAHYFCALMNHIREQHNRLHHHDHEKALISHQKPPTYHIPQVPSSRHTV